MGLRYRRSIRLAPGVRLNVSKSGLSASVGARGASVTLGKQGAYANLGIPGSGLSVREKLGGSAPASQMSSSTLQYQVGLTDDGRVSLRDSDGNALSPGLEAEVKRQRGDQIRAWLEERCDYWNQGIDRIVQFHLDTPSPQTVLSLHQRRPFLEAQPREADERKLGLLDRLSGERRRRIETENATAAKAYEHALAQWRARQVAHEERELNRQREFEEGRLKDPSAMEEILAARLADIEWPRETLVSFTVEDSGACVALDVDLPEVEDMPRQQARVASRGFQVLIRDKTDTQIRKEYMAHVHAVAFRLIGEVFVTLPASQTVICSGYSQRPDPSSGNVRDDYLYSVKVTREAWSDISFDNLKALDPVACLERLGVHRRMSKTGVFAAIDRP